jgi:iron complex outermembrane recepter protein
MDGMAQRTVLAFFKSKFFWIVVQASFALIGTAPLAWAAELDNLGLAAKPSSDQEQPSAQVPTPSAPAPSTPAPSPGAAPITITAVEVQPTPGGVAVRLVALNNVPVQATTSEQGKTLTITIPNARLQLANAATFQKTQPSSDLESVSVVQVNPTTVQVTIVGQANLPKAAILTQSSGLVINVAKDEADDEEVVVTAQRREERPRDIPFSITAFDQQTIQDAQLGRVGDLSTRVPNLNISPSSSGRIFTFYSLRGLNNANFLSRKDVVGFYVDDVPYDYAGFIDFDLVDLERIEVLRGPQSTLYGRNSQAGVVNILTRRPTNQPEFRFNASYASFDTTNLGIAYSSALIPDKLKFRIVGNFRQTDGFSRNTFLNTDAGEQREGGGRGELLWTPSAAWEVSLRAGGTFSRDGDSVYAPLNVANPYDVQYNRDGVITNNTTTQALRVNFKGNAFNFTSITTHRFSRQTARESDSDYSPFDIFVANYGFKSNVWTQELRLQSPQTADKFRWIAGTYLEANNFAVEGEGFTTVGTGTNTIFADTASRTFALFGQIDYKPIRPLTLTAGLRYEYNYNTIDRNATFTPEGSSTSIPSPGSLTVNGQEVSNNAFLPRFAINYQINSNLSVYGSIARGYKPGGFNYRAENPSFLTFKPEQSWNYEIGLKSSLWGDRFSASLALFRTNLENYQVILPGPDGFFRDITNAEVGIKGLELEIQARPVNGLQLNASLGILDGEFKQYRNPFTGVDFSGNRLNYAPNLTYNFGVQYRSRQGIFGRIEVQGFGTTYFDDANELRQNPYALVNMRLGYEAKNYGIYIFGNNILDTNYLTGAFVFPPPNVIGSFGNRATFGVQVKLKF